MEIWKDIIEFEGAYKVSNLGRILDVKTGKIRKLCRDKDGYYQLGMMKNGKRVFRKVHRLVAEAFLDNPNSLPLINHKNEIKTDNRPENLEWCTQAYNNAYGSRSIGRTVLKMDLFGNIIEKYCSLSDAANRNSKDKKTIYRWCLKMNKTKAGFVWAFGD